MTTLTHAEEVKEMANTKTQELLYAAVGVGDFALEKVRNLPSLAEPKTRSKVYKNFVKRGRTLTTRIKSSAPTKQAIDQAKSARAQVKAARTSVTKAIRVNARGSSQRAAEQTKIARSQVKAAATSVRKAASAGARATKSAADKAVQAS